MRSSIPKYLTVKSLLQTRLVREMTTGQRLPSEVALCEDFGVSRITMQQALRMLEDEGWIRREQGRGTFYLGHPSGRMTQRPSELLETLVSQREGAEMRILQKCVQEPPPQVAERLRLAPGEQVVALERLGIVEGEPLLYVYTYIPYELGRKFLDDSDVFAHMSIAAQIQDKYDVEISELEQVISASLADPHFAEHLGVEMGAPVLQGQRTYYDRDGKPIFCTTAFYRADRHCFAVRLKDWRN